MLSLVSCSMSLGVVCVVILARGVVTVCWVECADGDWGAGCGEESENVGDCLSPLPNAKCPTD